MKKIFFAVLLLVMGMLFSTSAFAHDGETHDAYEEGSGGSSMDMGHKSGGHEYKGDHGGDHSKEYYEKKYGKYDHEKHKMEHEMHEMKEEGSGMKEDAHEQMQKEMHERKEEGSKM